MTRRIRFAARVLRMNGERAVIAMKDVRRLVVPLAALFLSALHTGAHAQAYVSSVRVTLHTSSGYGCGTDDAVWLGLGGREFRLDRPGINDLEKGNTDVFVLGEGGNVIEADSNDPRHDLVLTPADVEAFPIYIRKAQDGPNGAWCLCDTVKVVINIRPGRLNPDAVFEPRTYQRAINHPLTIIGLQIRNASGLMLYVRDP